MELETTIPSEVTQTQKDKHVCFYSYVDVSCHALEMCVLSRNPQRLGN